MVSGGGRTVPSGPSLKMVAEAKLDASRHFPQELRLSFDYEKGSQYTEHASRDCGSNWSHSGVLQSSLW